MHREGRLRAALPGFGLDHAGQDGAERRAMGKKKKRKEREEVEQDELDENAELLPDREAMSMIKPPGDPTMPIDPPGGGDVTLPIEPPATE
jgi:hypothetical protein